MSSLRGLGNIARRWRELNGVSYWKGLLDPLDVDLRNNIINYGELSQAAYTGLNRERRSRYAGSCLFSRKDFLSRVDVSNPNLYVITKFIYAMCTVSLPDAFMIKSWSKAAWSKQSNWMGFVAVATDEGKEVLGRRDVVVAWRGTIRMVEWMDDLDISLVPASEIVRPGSADDPCVHGGWLSVYTSADPESQYNKQSARYQVLNEIKRLQDMYEHEETSITITGHSLGAALATINATDIVSNGYNKSCPVSAFVFGSPRVGNPDFQKAFDSAPDLRLLRIRNSPDVVPNWPKLGYSDAGTELMIDTGESPYLKAPGNPLTWHDMECYMHGVAGTQGSNGGFKLEIDRDIALVNKHEDALKNEYAIPSSWWVVQNKGMVKGTDGRWHLADHEDDD
ncbi:phospholipase A1-II 1 [Oryza glaberrima]|uniref:Phospholipase A1 n=1 Tax=Oryza nivara TaxID=4536 RepID=A0A0E0FQB7_ORYNI|nr:phospholipase A1-II 1 [Oryza glaberrima]